VLVVYESMFGNTAAIASAVCQGATDEGVSAEAVDVASAPADLGDVELLIVGAPTHAFGLSRPATRASAAEQGGTAGGEVGVREWLAGIPRRQRRTRAACFDTRLSKPFPVGSAARGIRRRLRRLGFDVTQRHSFVVGGTPGPLAEGEEERARQWGAALAASVAGEVRSGR
jgi:hypothetical protein